jgi:phosphonopyruvate decarboxylase
MISSNQFVQTLIDRGITRFTGVPCSFFQAAINRILEDSRLQYVIAPNEGAALSMAAGSSLAGAPMAVLIQNSGFGNLINPLTSLNLIYHIPTLVFMSGRAYGVEDEPQHEIMGKAMTPLLEAMGVPYQDMPLEPNDFAKALDDASAVAAKERKPFFFLVRKDTIEDYVPEKKDVSGFPLKRIDAIRAVVKELEERACIVATTGKPSRELFSIADRPNNFYMQGSMGHAAAIGFGIALSRPSVPVIVLDGDGALLMHLGILSTIGHYSPSNLIHIVLDNESYETTGDQDTTSATTDFAAIAKAAGYISTKEVRSEKEITKAMNDLLRSKGPSLLRIKINRLPTAGVPRISGKYSSAEIAANFSKSLVNL